MEKKLKKQRAPVRKPAALDDTDLIYYSTMSFLVITLPSAVRNLMAYMPGTSALISTTC